jgi:hypothetical protein
MALGLTATLTLLSRAGAQDPPERERVFCDPSDPCNQCPGRFCACLDDTLEVTFDGDSASVLEYEAFRQDMRIDTVIVTDTRTRGIQGWSYAVEHEDAFLTLVDVTVDGTEAERARDGGFILADMRDIEACLLPVGPRCSEAVPGAGYIAATVLHLTERAELPLGRNRICRATYALASDPGRNGTLIQVVDRRLAKKASPPVDLIFTMDSARGARDGYPSRIIDGWLKRKGQGTLESCDNQIDDDGDGRTDCEDWDCLGWSNCIPEGRAVAAGGPGSEASFRRGDADRSGRISVLDAVLIIRVLLGKAESVFDCDDALDVTDDGRVDVVDPVRLLQFLLDRGPGLPAPFPGCGPDPTPEPQVLACRKSSCEV